MGIGRTKIKMVEYGVCVWLDGHLYCGKDYYTIGSKFRSENYFKLEEIKYETRFYSANG